MRLRLFAAAHDDQLVICKQKNGWLKRIKKYIEHNA